MRCRMLAAHKKETHHKNLQLLGSCLCMVPSTCSVHLLLLWYEPTKENKAFLSGSGDRPMGVGTSQGSKSGFIRNSLRNR